MQRQLREALERLDPENRDQVDSLAESIAKDSKEEILALVRYVHDPDPKLSGKATAVLSGLNELAILPMLEASPPKSVAQRVWMIRTAVDAETEFRRTIQGRLEKLMDDTATVPIPKGPNPVEEPIPPRRVCDEVYCELRRLLNPQEKDVIYTMNIEAFLNLSNANKDSEINQARRRHVWTNFVGDIKRK